MEAWEAIDYETSSETREDELLDFLPVWAFVRASLHPSMMPRRLARAELHAVQHIMQQASRCLQFKCAEATWNCRVHDPLLELALYGHDPRVRYENATSAKILGAFVPPFSTGNTVVEGKMVDYVLTRSFAYDGPFPRTRQHGADVEVDSAIRAKLECQPGSRPYTVNQTAIRH